MATVLKALDWRQGIAAEPIAFPARRKPLTAWGTIYFVGPEAGIVKIGFTTNLAMRLPRLQCGSPVPLKVLAFVEGARELEGEYHRQFASAREHGEWFLRTTAVDAEIERLRKAAATPASDRHASSLCINGLAKRGDG